MATAERERERGEPPKCNWREAPEAEDRTCPQTRFQIRVEVVRSVGDAPVCPGCRAAMGRETHRAHTHRARDIAPGQTRSR